MVNKPKPSCKKILPWVELNNLNEMKLWLKTEIEGGRLIRSSDVKTKRLEIYGQEKRSFSSFSWYFRNKIFPDVDVICDKNANGKTDSRNPRWTLKSVPCIFMTSQISKSKASFSSTALNVYNNVLNIAIKNHHFGKGYLKIKIYFK